LIALPGYRTAAKAYQKATGRSPVKDRPCAVVLWRVKQDSIKAVRANQSVDDKGEEGESAVDAAALKKELAAFHALPCSIAKIPFGVSRQTFLLLAGKAGFDMLSDEGTFLLCSKVPLGERFFTGAFHFDSLDHFYRYELEGIPCSIDSLDGTVHPEADYLAKFFEKNIAAPPLTSNRVGRHEIVREALTLTKAWSQPSWSVSVGIAEHAYRYYAKAVVMNKGIAKE
jgi:hypothetical protein